MTSKTTTGSAIRVGSARRFVRHRRLLAIALCLAGAGWGAVGPLASSPVEGAGPTEKSRLTVSRPGVGSAILNEPTAYTITVRNLGSNPVTRLQLAQSFSRRVTFQSSPSSASCDASAQSLTCAVADLGPGQSTALRFVVVPRELGTLVDELRASSDQTSPVTPPSLSWNVQPRPVLGSTVNFAPVTGFAYVRTPAATRYRRLTIGRTLPVGTTIDSRRGKVRVRSVRNRRGPLQAADFYAGAFTVRQASTAAPITLIQAVGGDFRSCVLLSRNRAARQAQASKPRRRVWGSGRGRYRTRGRYGAATVRGTVWLTEDRCDGTLFVVRSGVVSVFDFALRRTVVVTAGHSYLVRARPS